MPPSLPQVCILPDSLNWYLLIPVGLFASLRLGVSTFKLLLSTISIHFHSSFLFSTSCQITFILQTNSNKHTLDFCWSTPLPAWLSFFHLLSPLIWSLPGPSSEKLQGSPASKLTARPATRKAFYSPNHLVTCVGSAFRCLGLFLEPRHFVPVLQPPVVVDTLCQVHYPCGDIRPLFLHHFKSTIFFFFSPLLILYGVSSKQTSTQPHYLRHSTLGCLSAVIVIVIPICRVASTWMQPSVDIAPSHCLCC